MDIEINNKTYEVNDDITLGTLYRLQQHPNDLKYLFAFLKEAVLPTPSDKELLKFKKSDVKRLMAVFELLQEDDLRETKKKLSR